MTCAARKRSSRGAERSPRTPLPRCTGGERKTRKGRCWGTSRSPSRRRSLGRAGILPVTIVGGGNRIEARRASSRLLSFICSICHTSLEVGFRDGLLPLDVAIFSPICDVARSLSGIWKRNFPSAFVKILYLPQNLCSAGALDFLAGENAQLSVFPLATRLANADACVPKYCTGFRG